MLHTLEYLQPCTTLRCTHQGNSIAFHPHSLASPASHLGGRYRALRKQNSRRESSGGKEIESITQSKVWKKRSGSHDWTDAAMSLVSFPSITEHRNRSFGLFGLKVSSWDTDRTNKHCKIMFIRSFPRRFSNLMSELDQTQIFSLETNITETLYFLLFIYILYARLYLMIYPEIDRVFHRATQAITFHFPSHSGQLKYPYFVSIIRILSIFLFDVDVTHLAMIQSPANESCVIIFIYKFFARRITRTLRHSARFYRDVLTLVSRFFIA